MKLFLMLLGMAVAGVAGFFTEPSLRHTFTGSPADAPSTGSRPTLASLNFKPADLNPEQLPEKVTLRDKVSFEDETSGLTLTIAAGSTAKLVRIENDKAVVRPGDTEYSVEVPLEQTDLIEYWLKNPPTVDDSPDPFDGLEP